MKRTLAWITAAAAGVAFVVAGIGWQRETAARRALLVAARPAQPDLARFPPVLRRRIEACERRIAADDEAPAALGELGRLYHANGFYSEATQCYGTLVRVDPSEPRWAYSYATLLAAVGDIEPAQDMLERVLRRVPDYLPARIRLGQLCISQGRFAAATEVFAAALKITPNNPHATYGLARCDYEAGRWEQARERLAWLFENTKSHFGADLLARVYEKLGQDDRAARYRAITGSTDFYCDPVDPWMDDLLDDCYDPYPLSVAGGRAAFLGEIEAGLRRLEQAVALEPNNAQLHFGLAKVQYTARDYTKAREHFERCTVINPEFPDPWGYLVVIATTVGNPREAERMLAEGLRHCPKSPALHLHRARMLAAGQSDEAVREFQTSIQLRPNEAAAYVELAKFDFSLGRMAEGLAELDRALGAEPEHPAVLQVRVMHAILTADDAAARQWLRRAAAQPRVAPEDLEKLKRAYLEKFGRPF